MDLPTQARRAADAFDNRTLFSIIRRLRHTIVPNPNLHDAAGRPVTTDAQAAAAYATQFVSLQGGESIHVTTLTPR